ncbi:unnamed protein product, partial [Ixodes persulcatus]
GRNNTSSSTAAAVGQLQRNTAGIPTTQVSATDSWPQGTPPPMPTHAFSMSASIIERHPLFIWEPYSFLAQFAPLPPSPYGTQPELGNRQEEQPSHGDNRQSSETAHTQSGAATPSNTGRCPETQDSNTTVQDCGVPPREFKRAQIGEIYRNLTLVPLTPSATMDAGDTEWPIPSPGRKRRRGFETSGHSKQVELVQLAQPPTQTVVLRSVGKKKKVGANTGKEIKEAVERAGIQTTDQYTIRRNEKANAISLMTKDPLCLDKLLKVTEIRKVDEVHPLQPYKALSGNQCQGIIYLKGEGNDVALESLATDICSRTNTIVAAIPLGRKGNTILVTFEGR